MAVTQNDTKWLFFAGLTETHRFTGRRMYYGIKLMIDSRWIKNQSIFVCSEKNSKRCDKRVMVNGSSKKKLNVCYIEGQS